MKSNFWIYMITFFTVNISWGAHAERDPIRQIDRSLVMPKNMWQENLSWGSMLQLDGDNFEDEASTPAGFIPNLPSWSITDRLEWTAIPLPNFKYLLLGNVGRDSTSFAANPLNLALGGGISGFVFSARGTYLSTWAGLSFKKQMGHNFWTEGGLTGMLINTETLFFQPSMGLGYQWTERVYTKSRYDYVQAISKKSVDGDKIHYLTQAMGVNFTPHISLEVYGSFINPDTDSFFNSGANLTFRW